MNILVDVGNSRIKWRMTSIESDGGINAFAYKAETLVTQLDALFQVPKQQIDNVYVSNVAGEKIKSKLIQWFADRLNIKPKFATSRKEMRGLRSAYIQPDQLGVDRFLGMIGAQLSYEGAKVVVDCGTATTVDCINSDSEFIGGVILPGLSLMRASLSVKANALNFPMLDEGVTLFATDTTTAISSGTIFSITGVIESAVKKMSKMSGAEVGCIITGGDGETIQSYLDIDSDYQEDLVLKGLSAYFQEK
ncbi:MAG: type III pantothenate kinase [Gammaproteobacteria bacterium]|nr:type III pantothenate kinase [Gammaproteobacteria bacterium]